MYQYGEMGWYGRYARYVISVRIRISVKRKMHRYSWYILYNAYISAMARWLKFQRNWYVDILQYICYKRHNICTKFVISRVSWYTRISASEEMNDLSYRAYPVITMSPPFPYAWYTLDMCVIIFHKCYNKIIIWYVLYNKPALL